MFNYGFNTGGGNVVSFALLCTLAKDTDKSIYNKGVYLALG